MFSPTILLLLALFTQIDACTKFTLPKVDRAAWEIYHGSYHPSKVELLYDSKIEGFAHEGPVYDNSLNALMFTSNRIVRDTQHINVSMIYVPKVRAEVNLDLGVPMANGACATPHGSVLVCAQGDMEKPSGIYEVSLRDKTAKIVLGGLQGKQFNSPNDVIFDSKSQVWFTDPSYGHEQGFRPTPQLPNSIYRGVYKRGKIEKVESVITGLVKPNGIALSVDEKQLFATDTGYVRGDGCVQENNPRAVYVWDIINNEPKNKRLFAAVKEGIPDGIKCTKDLVYVGCGDGVHVFDKKGKLVAKALVPGGVANFAFGPHKQIFMLSEQKIFKTRRL